MAAAGWAIGVALIGGREDREMRGKKSKRRNWKAVAVVLGVYAGAGGVEAVGAGSGVGLM